MTLEQAKAEAIERWGDSAIATYTFQLTENCEVASDPSVTPFRRGIGASFEEAFVKAEKSKPYAAARILGV